MRWRGLRRWRVVSGRRLRGLRISGRLPIRLHLSWMRHSQQSVPSDQSCAEAQHASRQTDTAPSRAKSFQAQDANDTLGQGAAFCAQGKDWSAAPFFHQRKPARIFDGVAAELHSHVVAAMLAFGSNFFIQPPDFRMVKEQHLHANLEHIQKRIKLLDVRQFVGDYCLKLFFGQSRESSNRQEDDWSKPPDYRRRLQPLTFAVGDSALEAESVLQRAANLQHALAYDRRLSAALPCKQQKSACRAKAEASHAQEPGF